MSCSLVFRVRLLCAQKSLLCGSTEPSDQSGPSSTLPEAGSSGAVVSLVDGLFDGAEPGSLSVLPPVLGLGRSGSIGARLVASGESTGVGETATVWSAGGVSSPFTAEATA